MSIDPVFTDNNLLTDLVHGGLTRRKCQSGEKYIPSAYILTAFTLSRTSNLHEHGGMTSRHSFHASNAISIQHMINTPPFGVPMRWLPLRTLSSFSGFVLGAPLWSYRANVSFFTRVMVIMGGRPGTFRACAIVLEC